LIGLSERQIDRRCIGVGINFSSVCDVWEGLKGRKEIFYMFKGNNT
jgi:hypothetical protein